MAGSTMAATEPLEALLQGLDPGFRAIVLHSADAIVVVDRTGAVRFANPAAEALFGRPAEALVDRPFGYPVVAGETSEIDVPRPGRDTAIAEIRVVEVPWRGEQAWLATLRDVTPRRRLESQLRRARGVVEREVRARTAELRRTVEELRAANAELERYIWQSAGGGAVRREPVPLDGVVAAACRELETELTVSGATVAYSGLPTVAGDPARLQQLMEILIAAAVRWGRADVQVVVSVRAAAMADCWCISVVGRGETDDEDEDAPVAGMAVCRRIVEGHGGTLWLESTPGEGTAVHFTLPMAAP